MYDTDTFLRTELGFRTDRIRRGVPRRGRGLRNPLSRRPAAATTDGTTADAR